MKTNWIKAMQEKLLEIGISKRVGFLKVEEGEGTAIVFNETDWKENSFEGYDFSKGINFFTVLIDIVVKYEDYKKGLDGRLLIRKEIGDFNGKLTEEREGTIRFLNFLAPSYDRETDSIIFGGLYLLKENYDVDDTN